MKHRLLPALVALLAVACKPSEEGAAASPSEAGKAPPRERAPGAVAGEDRGTPDGVGSGKLRERPPVADNKPPVAEPVADRPGFVVSPHNGKLIDVRDIPAGTLVADPTYPVSEKKYFRVPAMPEPGVATPTEDARAEDPDGGDIAPMAVPVPGKPGFVFSPFNNQIIDLDGAAPGSIVRDPGYPDDPSKTFRVPGGAIDPGGNEATE